MHQRLITCAALLFATFTSLAAPPTPESVDKLLELTRPQSMLDVMFASVENNIRMGMSRAAEGKTVNAAQQRALDEAPRRIAQVMREELSWEQLKPVYTQVYQDTFTQDEIDGLIAFYESAAGVAFVSKMPVALQKSNVALQAHLRPLLERMKAAIDQATQDAMTAK